MPTSPSKASAAKTMETVGFVSAAVSPGWAKNTLRSPSLDHSRNVVGKRQGKRRRCSMYASMGDVGMMQESEADTKPTFDIDKQFARLNHVNKNLRQKAAAEISENVTEQTIPRLISLLGIEDTGYRRAAVQALGMIGVQSVGLLCQALVNSENRTVRASCSKAMAAIAMYHPQERESFPEEGLDALEHALNEDPDPVTKLATVGCLGTMGSGSPKKDIRPNLRAIDFLLQLLESTDDMGIAATTIGALGQIGTCGHRESVLNALKAVTAKPDDEESGVNIIKDMAAAHVTQLESGSTSPVLVI